MTHLPLLMGIGFIAQLSGGALGMGYGVLSSTLLLATGMAPATVSASVHSSEVIATLASVASHHSFGNIDRRLAVPLIIPGVIGAVIGAWLLSHTPENVVRPWIAGALSLAGLVILWRFVIRRKAPTGETGVQPDIESPPMKKGLRPWQIVILGLAGGTLDAFGGGGWGPITTPILLLTHDIPHYKVVGSVTMASLFVSAASTITFLCTLNWAQFDHVVVISLLISGVIAAPVAAWATRKLSFRWFGLAIGLLLLTTNVRTIFLWITGT